MITLPFARLALVDRPVHGSSVPSQAVWVHGMVYKPLSIVTYDWEHWSCMNLRVRIQIAPSNFSFQTSLRQSPCLDVAPT
jgi:hypothetical protein